MDNIERFREAFPAVRKCLYFGTAGVGPLPQVALDRMAAAADRLRGDFTWNAWEEDLPAEARQLAAALIGAAPERVALTHSTSEGINLLAGGYPWRAGDGVILNPLEYPANVTPWLYQAERNALDVRVVPAKGHEIPVEDLIAAIDSRTRVLAVSHVEFGAGFRHDLLRLADAIHEEGGLLCVDAIQSIGALAVDVEALGIDVLATGGYKWLCGPLGTGFAYVRDAVAAELHPPTMDYANLQESTYGRVWDSLVTGADVEMSCSPRALDRRRFEGEGWSPVLMSGLAASLRLLLDVGIDAIAARIESLVSYAIDGLARCALPILSPTDPAKRSGIVTIGIPQNLRDPAQVKAVDQRMKDAKLVAFLRGGGLRLAIHAFNTEQEIDAAIDFVASL